MTRAHAAPDQAAPPFFVRLLTPEGMSVDRLVEHGASVADLGLGELKGRCRYEAVSPGGWTTQGSFAMSTRLRLHDQVCADFDVDVIAKLWFPRIDELCGPLPQHTPADRIAVWSSDGLRVLDNEDWSLGTEPSLSCLRHFTASTRHSEQNCYFLQTEDQEGLSVFAVMRSSDYLTVDPYDGRIESTEAWVLSPPGLHTAYWSFLRHNHAEATAAAAERLCARVLDERRGSYDELIACAHAIVNFRNRWSEAAVIRGLLAEWSSASLDARVMNWILAFDHGERDAFAHAFLDITDAIVASKPVYSGTFRLFYQRLAAAADLARTTDGSSTIDEHVAYLTKLAHATFWDAEHLSYSGLSPTAPDPRALARDSGVKKKDLSDEVRSMLERRLSTSEVATEEFETALPAPAKPAGITFRRSRRAKAPVRRDDGKITVVQVGSRIRKPYDQYQTLVGLGLGRIGKRRTLNDTPAIRGMIAKVEHLVRIEDPAEQEPAPPIPAIAAE